MEEHQRWRFRPVDPPGATAGTRRRLFLAIGIVLLAAVFGGLVFLAVRHADRDQKHTAPSSDAPMPEESGVSAGSFTPDIIAPNLSIEDLVAEEDRAIDGLAADYPGNSDAAALMATVYQERGQSETAIRYWQKALEQEPTRADAHASLGWISLSAEDYQAAVPMLANAVILDPSKPGVHHDLASALIGLQQFPKALEVLQQATRVFPQDTQSRYMLGQLQLQEHEHDEARRAFESVLVIEPSHRNACYGLAMTYARLKQSEQARKWMERFQQISEDELDARIDRIRRYDDLQSARQSVSRTLTEIGRLRASLNDIEKAQEHWRRAAVIDPSNSTCREELAR